MKPALPKSETHLPTNILGLCMALLAIYLLRDSGLTPLDTALAVLVASATPVILIEWLIFKRHREAAAALTSQRTLNAKRVSIKCLGLIGVLTCFTALYIAIPEYEDTLYTNVWAFYLLLLPILLIGAPFYFAWCDTRITEPEDGYYQFGRVLLLQWQQVDWLSIKRLFRDWLVKAFFLPLMFTYSVGSIQGLQNSNLTHVTDFLAFYAVAYTIIMFADLLYATLGYIFTLRILNSHIRSSEPTFLGWFVAVMCYAPFWGVLFYPHFFAYDDAWDWQYIIPQGIWQYVWGSVMLVAMCIYSTATLCLGLRFSNLTYRGLVTNGPYRFTKHPAYVSKNLSWWMVSIPFISSAGLEGAFAHTLALAGVSTIYFIRARTEERHLSNYPEYVEYALAMNERSIFAPLAKRVPFLRYKKPENLPKI